MMMPSTMILTLCISMVLKQLPKVDPENFTSDKFRRGGGYNPRNPPFAYGPACNKLV